MFTTSLYIFKRLCVAIGMSIVVLTILLWLTQSVKFLEIIVQSNTSIQGYFSLIVYLLPDLFVKVAPICVLIGGVLAYGKLTVDNELQVMQALGKSPWQIAAPGVCLAITLTAALLLLNIFAIPSVFRAFRDQEFQLRNRFSASLTREGGFNTIGGLTVFVKKRLSAREFEGVFIHDNGKSPHKKNDKAYTIFAKFGVLKKVGDKYALTLRDGVRQEKDKKNVIHSFEFASLVYDLNDFANIATPRNLKPYERDLKDLFRLDDDKTIDKKFRARLAAEGHQRLLLPFFCVINLLLTVTVMVLNRPSRRLRRRRMVTLIFTGIILQWSALNLLQARARFESSVALAYVMVIGLICVTGLYLKKGFVDRKLQRVFDRCGI